MKWLGAFTLVLVMGALLVSWLLSRSESVGGAEAPPHAEVVDAGASDSPARDSVHVEQRTAIAPVGEQPADRAWEVLGRLTMPNDKPASGEAVEFLEAPRSGVRPQLALATSDRVAWVSTTDEDGRFRANLDSSRLYAIRVVPQNPELATAILAPQLLDYTILIRLEPACDLRGVVTLDGIPLPDVPIRLSKRAEYPRHARREVGTQGDGTYALARLSAGNYVLQALPAGVPRASAVVALSTGSTVHDFELVSGASLRGWVLARGSRKALRGAEVALRGDFSQSIRVGNDGGFEVALGPEAERPAIIYARAAGYSDARVVVPEGRSDQLEIVLERGYRVFGKVQSEGTTKPLAGAIVTAAVRSISPTERANFKQTVTDATGSFVVEGIASGLDHVLMVEMPGYGTHVGPIECEATASGCDLGTIGLGEACSLRGQIVNAAGHGLEGFEVRIRRTAPELPAGWSGVRGWLYYALPTISSVGGGFGFDSLAAGEYLVQAEWPGPERSWSSSLEIALGSAQSVDGLRFVVDDESTIDGRVLGPEGYPVEGAFLTLTTGGERWKRVADLGTGVDGTFRFDGIPSGPYKVTVQVEGDGGMGGGAAVASGASFDVVGGATGLELRLDAANPISGFVLDANERLIPGAMVMAVSGGYHTIDSCESDGDGAFILRGVSGVVDLLAVPTVFDSGYGMRTPDQSFGHTRFPGISAGSTDVMLRLPFVVPEDR